MPKTLGFEVTTDKEGNKQLLGLNTTLGSASSIILDNNSLIVFPNLFTILSKATDSNGTEYCLIHTITTNGKVVANESYAFKYYFDWDEWQKPSCKDCLQHTIAVYNAGNKEIKDQRVNICATNKIYNITGNDEFWISPDRCFEIRRETLLEKDEIAGRFIQEIPKKYTFNNRSIIFENRKYDVIAWNDGQSEAIEGLHVNTWNRNQQETDQLKIWNVAVIIIPNCHIGY